jgi:hypothetical protein
MECSADRARAGPGGLGQSAAGRGPVRRRARVTSGGGEPLSDASGPPAPDRTRLVLQAMVDCDLDESASILDRICAAAVLLLCLKGAGLSLIVDGQLRGTAGVSEPGIVTVQELQLSLGEGPCVDAWNQARPVMEPNLASPAETRWPAFSIAGVAAGVLAVFAFPLHVGAIRVGVLVLYRDRVGGLNDEEYKLALMLAETGTHAVLGLQAGAPLHGLHELLADQPPHWAHIHQATGILSVQLDASLEEAFVRMQAHAFAADRPLAAVAEDIVARRLRIGDLG